MFKTKHIFMLLAMGATAAFLVHLQVPGTYVLGGLLVALYLDYRTKLEQISNDLRMVEGFLDERFSDELNPDEFRRKF